MQDKSMDDDLIFNADDAPDSDDSQTNVHEESITISVAEYEKLKNDLESANDRSLRALAELENFRNRTNRLAQEERKYASMDLARDVIPLWDNLELALNVESPEENAATIIEGVRMVHQEFLNALSKHGIHKIDALYQPFDPKFHESVAFAPTDEFPPNTVIVELKAGFTLHDRVVRAAQVVLAAPSSKPKESVDTKDN